MSKDDLWDPGGIINPDRAPQELVPALMLATRIMLLHRISTTLPAHDEARRQRVNEARRLLIDDGTQQMQQLDEALRIPLDLDPGKLQAVIAKRLPEAICLDVLITAWNTNPFAPYEIKLSKTTRIAALRLLAKDLGLPASWADDAVGAADEARRAQRTLSPLAWVIAPVGVVGIIIALPLAAPLLAASGLAGGAAFLSGLAALGGSVMGGLSILTAAGALGSMGLTAVAFILGTPQQVEERVVTLHAMALAKHSLRPGTKSRTEQKLLKQMHKALKDQLETHKKVDDGRSQAQAQLKQKLTIVKRAIKALKKEDLFDD